MNVVAHGFRDAGLMAWEVWWALVLGFAISAVVQARVPRARIEAALSGSGPRTITLATGLGAASSSCSYAAVAIARSLFEKGASAVSALAFQFASTNLVWELGLVLWVLIGPSFTVAEYVGGLVMIVLMAALLRLFVSPALERDARSHARSADTADHHHHGHGPAAGGAPVWSRAGLAEIGGYFLADVRMLWKEVLAGFLIAGFLAQLGDGFFASLFIHHAPAPLPALENVIVGPLVAVASFVCSIGNVPLAAVLWSGGISFGGVLAFLFADLIVLPIVAIYRKYYGTRFALRITALMFVTMVIAALVVQVIFGSVGAIPTGHRPTRADIFGHVQLDYKLALNVLGLVVFVALMSAAADRWPRSADAPAH